MFFTSILSAAPSSERAETKSTPASGIPLKIEGVSKTFNGRAGLVEALQPVDISVAAGEFVCLLGPSGCGKSTLLNAVAGFSLPNQGVIRVNGQAVTQPGPDRGMVFQEYALFPWMTVAQNVGFGLEIKKLPKADIRSRVDALLKLLKL